MFNAPITNMFDEEDSQDATPPHLQGVITASSILAPARVVGARKVRPHKTQARRSYSLNVALQFQPVFDKIIKSNYTEEHLIPYYASQLKPSTLYVYVNDALKYLSDVDIEKSKSIDAQAYAKIQLLYEITREFHPTNGSPFGIGLRRRTGVVKAAVSEILTTNTIADKPFSRITNTPLPKYLENDKAVEGVDKLHYAAFTEWKELVVYFVENCVNDTELRIMLDTVTLDDNSWLSTFCNGMTTADMNVDYIVEVDCRTIKLAKMKVS